MIMVVGASSSKTIFGSLLRWYMGRKFNHIYNRYEAPFTKSMLVSESSYGEHHNILLSNWYARGNRIHREYAIEVSEELFRAILKRNEQLLQASYSEKNIFGTLFYDLYEKFKWRFLLKLAYKFRDGDKATICSEASAFTLMMVGVKFNRPLDFVKPDIIIDKLEELVESTDFVRRV